MDAVVYTDLDGTLLDHHDYSFAAAMPAINKLNKLQVPIVPVTSKTRAELTQLRSQLNLSTPFIVENGAAVFIPDKPEFAELSAGLARVDDYFVQAFSPKLDYWTQLMDELLAHVGVCFQPFSKMSLVNIVELTGLTNQQAALAANREFSDPIYWYGNEAEFRKLCDFCAEQQVQVVRGGRFVHLLKGADKGKALTWLHRRFEAVNSRGLTSIALGDGENDIAMLEQVNIAVQIRSPKNDFPVFSAGENQQLIQTSSIGPAGWNEAIEEILNN